MAECLLRLEGAAEPLDWPGMIYNVSATGVGLALAFPAGIGTVLVIEPRRRAGGLRLRATVVRCDLQEYVWFHGCQFIEPIREAEFPRCLDILRGVRR
jgi:hypothetical protein